MTRVAIQGRLNAAQWVTKFKLAYGYDGVFFKDYKEDGDTAKVKDTPLKTRNEATLCKEEWYLHLTC